MDGERARVLIASISILLALECFKNRSLKLSKHKWTVVWAAVYAIADLATQSARAVLDYKDFLLLVSYGILSGNCSAHWAKNNDGKHVLHGLLLFSTLMALFGVLMLRAAGVENLVVLKSSGLNRSNLGYSVSFLIFFNISNVVIGIVAYTILALSWLPVLLLKLGNRFRMIIISGVAIGIYSNLKTVTRTNFACIGLGAFFIYVLMIVAEPALRRRLTMVGLYLVLVVLLFGAALVAVSDDLSNLLERFSNIDEDSRVDVWRESLLLLSSHPGGHGIDGLTTHLWAHNIFLDVGLTSGWLGLSAVIGLVATTIFNFLRLCRRAGIMKNSLFIYIICSALTILFASMLHPPIPHYVAWLIFSGSFARELWVPPNALKSIPTAHIPSTGDLRHLASWDCYNMSPFSGGSLFWKWRSRRQCF